jgi:hypothetical protein
VDQPVNSRLTFTYHSLVVGVGRIVEEQSKLEPEQSKLGLELNKLELNKLEQNRLGLEPNKPVLDKMELGPGKMGLGRKELGPGKRGQELNTTAMEHCTSVWEVRSWTWASWL